MIIKFFKSRFGKKEEVLQVETISEKQVEEINEKALQKQLDSTIIEDKEKRTVKEILLELEEKERGKSLQKRDVPIGKKEYAERKRKKINARSANSTVGVPVHQTSSNAVSNHGWNDNHLSNYGYGATTGLSHLREDSCINSYSSSNSYDSDSSSSSSSSCGGGDF